MRIYTDGSASPDGRGGWAWINVDDHTADSGSESNTTNQRMEMLAVIMALQANPGTVTIVTDSAYVMNCFVQSWYVKWKRNGWRNTTGEPVANQLLWEKLITLVEANWVTFEKVKGHSGDPDNDAVDKLAVAAKNRGPG